MTYNFRTEQMVEVALIYNVDVQKIIDGSKKVLMLTPSEWEEFRLRAPDDMIALHSDSVFEIHYSSQIGMAVKVRGQLSDKPLLLILGAAYLLDFPNLERNYDKYRNYIDTYADGKNAIANISRQISDRIEQIRDISKRINTGKLTISTRDVLKVLPKACKKMKIGFEIKNEKFYFTFKNVVITNQVEGTLRYKSITLVTTREFSIKDVIYEFNGFTMQNSWGLNLGYMHPHISGTIICYGNRSDDFHAYLENSAYEFIALLYKESVHSYDNHNPYESLVTIARKITALEKVVKVHKVFEDNVLVTPETNPKKYAQLMFNSLKRCNVCRHFLDPSIGENQELVWSSCINPSCHSNPHAEIHCPECQSLLVRGDWNYDRYNYECHNAQCRASVQYRAMEQKREEIRNKFRDLVYERVKAVPFINKSGREISVAEIDGQLVKCPICNMPLAFNGRLLTCTQSGANSLCYNVSIYMIEDGVSDELMDSYLETGVPDKLPDNYHIYRHRYYSNINTRITANLLRIAYAKGFSYECSDCERDGLHWDNIDVIDDRLAHDSCGTYLELTQKELYEEAIEKGWIKRTDYTDNLFNFSQERTESDES